MLNISTCYCCSFLSIQWNKPSRHTTLNQRRVNVNATSFGSRREKTCLRWFANNKGADQPAHPRSLISAFVIRLSKSIISRLITSEISIFQLVSEAEETGLKLALSETPKIGFLATRPISSHRRRYDVV